MCWLQGILLLLAVGQQPAGEVATRGMWAGLLSIGAESALILIDIPVSGAVAGGTCDLLGEGIRLAPIQNLICTETELRFGVCGPERNLQFEGTRQGSRIVGELAIGRDRLPVTLLAVSKLGPADIQRFEGDYQSEDGDNIFLGFQGNPTFLSMHRGDGLGRAYRVGASTFLSSNGQTLNFEEKDEHAMALVITSPMAEVTTSRRVVHYRDEDVQFRNGDVTLSGTLYLPDVDGVCPAIVFVHGSGPQDRFGYRIYSDLFARAGLAVLSYDKRGTGTSTGDWQQADFDALAGDVLAGVKLLQSRSGIRKDRIGLFGISQAGWIIPLAASLNDDISFGIVISGSSVSPANQELWRRSNNLRFLKIDERLLPAIQQGISLGYQWDELHKRGEFPIPCPFGHSGLDMYFQPEARIRQLKQPFLVIYGSADTLAPPHEGAATWSRLLQEGGNRDSTVKVFPHGTHGMLIAAATGNPREVLREPRFVPGYLDTLISWTRGHCFEDAQRPPPSLALAAGPAPIEATGLEKLGSHPSLFDWRSAPVQVSIMLKGIVLFASTLLVAVAGIVSRNRAGIHGTLLAVIGLLGLATLGGLIGCLYMLAEEYPLKLANGIPLLWWGTMVAAWSFVMVTLCFWAIVLWRRQPVARSRFLRLYEGAVGIFAMGWIGFLWHWHLLWL